MKNDPHFAGQVFKLQAAIKEADAPQNLAQTYFGTNAALTLDTREWTEGGVADKGIAGVRKACDSIFSESERQADEEADGGRRQQLNQKERDEDHARYTEVKAVAQTLAFRVLDGDERTNPEPSKALRDAVRVINSAYDKSESLPSSFPTFAAAAAAARASTSKNVPFRRPCDVLTPSMLQSMLATPGVECMVAEVPNGKGAVPDGTVIAAACYAVTAGVRSSSASVSLLAVDQRFWHLYVGKRLLAKVERRILTLLAATTDAREEGRKAAQTPTDGMTKRGDADDDATTTVRTYTCLPSPLLGTQVWLERQGYRQSSTAVYPFDDVPFEILPEFKEGVGGDDQGAVEAAVEEEGTTATKETKEQQPASSARHRIELGVYCKVLRAASAEQPAKAAATPDERDDMLPKSGFAGPRRAEKIREQVRETMDIFDAAEAAKRGIAWS